MIRVVASLFAAGLAFAAATAQEGELVAQEAAGVIAVDGESRLVVRGFQGDVHVRAGKPGEVKFMSARLGVAADKLPVAVWVSGSDLRIEPAAGTEGEPRTLEVVVDPGLLVQVREAQGAVGAAGLGTGLQVSGGVADVDVRAVSGPVEIDIAGGSARVQEVRGDVEVRARSAAVTLGRIDGDVLLGLDGSSLEATKIAGGVEGEVRDGTWKLDEIAQPVTLRSVGGKGEVRGLGLGGGFRMSGTPLTVTDSKGEIDIETDAAVRFDKNQAALHVNSFGGSVNGRANEGLVEVRTDGSQITLDAIAGPVRVQGQNLTLQLKGVSGELFVDADASDVEIDGAAGEVSIVSGGSRIVVRNASHFVEVEANGGDLEILDLRGWLDVRADCDRVVVAWATQVPQKDSSVKNSGGGVEMQFPANSQAQVEAESKFGSVETTLEGLEVNDAASQASGALGLAPNRPVIRIVAERDVVLTERRAEDE